MVRILDLYCGMGGLSLGFALALEGAGILGLDIDKDAVATYNLNLARLGCRAEKRDALAWKPSGGFDVVVGGPPCFPPDAPVVVNDDLLAPISELREGEGAVTHEGRSRTVTKVFRRPYKGKLVSLKVALLNIPIRVTPNHPFLAYRPKPCYAGFRKPCTPTCQGGYSRIDRVVRGERVYEYVRTCRRREGEIAWVEAGRLRPLWDFVALRIPQAEPPPDAPRDPELWYLLGLYVAEGSAHVKVRRRGSRERRYHYVVFYLGKHERDLIERVRAIAARRGWRSYVRYERTAARVYVWSADLHRLALAYFGKYVDEKRVPLWVLGLPSECRSSFLRGIRDGDGDAEKFVTTVNPIIAFAVWLLALSLGVPASLSRVAMPPTKVIEGRVVRQSPYLYKVKEIRRKNYAKVGRFFFSDGYVWLEVKRADWEDYEGEVFNLEVEEDHTYLVWGIVVHNCQPFSHANVSKIGEAHQLYPTFPRFFDVVLALKPTAFLLENVKGLLRKRFEPILRRQLERVAGEYDIRHAVLNAVSYGVPQRRERLFVVGIRKDTAGVFRFPEPTHGERPLARLDGTAVHKWVTLREAIGDLAPLPPEEMARLVVAPKAAERIRKEREDEDKYWAKMEFPDDPDKPSRTIAAHTVEGAKKSTIVVPTQPIAFRDSAGNVVEIPWTRFQDKHKPLEPDKPGSAVIGNLAKFSRCALIPVAKDDEVHEGGFSPLYLSRNRRPEWDEPSFTVLASARHEPLHPASESMVKAGRDEWRFAGGGVVYRRLSVRECLRVQSFPDWWRFPNGVSTTKKYRLVGEAVPPILAYRLAVALGRALGLPVREPPREEEWRLPYFRRAFADYFGG